MRSYVTGFRETSVDIFFNVFGGFNVVFCCIRGGQLMGESVGKRPAKVIYSR